MKSYVLKKTLFALFVSIIFTVNSFAQFLGGGSGTEEDPYQIWNKSHWDEFATEFNSHNEENFGDFAGIHLRLMHDITETVNIMPSFCNGEGETYNFNGNFHGAGHSINIYPDSTQTCSVFGIIGENGYLDSLQIAGTPYYFTSLVYINQGVVLKCTCNVEITPPIVPIGYRVGICYLNEGIIEECINLTDFSNTIHPDTQESDTYFIAGIVTFNHGTIRHCINMGNISAKDIFSAAGLVNWSDFHSITEHCINYGNLSVQNLSQSDECNFGGICGWVQNYAVIQNCINMGNIDFSATIPGGGIVGINYSEGDVIPVINCLNIGNINGTITFNNQNTNGGGGILGCFNSALSNAFSNCLNIGKVTGSAIIDSVTYDTLALATNNFYDKQMCLSKGINEADVLDSAEGKLTTQLTGTSAELQEMLGDGWSYAEGRYPIPLGLENDSMALVAATPVYLHFETEEDYNHVDSVTKNFIVGLENNVSWDDANGRVSFSDENVTLLNLGVENLTVSLGDYSKNVRINIVDIETSAPIQTIENGISAYPNPASDYINLNLNGIQADKLEIYDIAGKLLSTNNINSELTKVFTGNLKSGIYLLKFYNKSQIVTILRFVKN